MCPKIQSAKLLSRFLKHAFVKLAAVLFSASMLSPCMVSAAAKRWVLTGGPEGGRVYALAVDPQSPTTVYASGYGKALYKSTNSGANWGDTGLATAYVYDVAVDPSNSTTVYACGASGVFKSTNAGANWSAVNTSLRSVYSLAIDPQNSATLYVGIDGGGVYKSTALTGNRVSRRTAYPSYPPIRENIAFGNSEGREDRDVDWAARVSQIAQDIDGFDNKMETYVGERGITLSGGQKQRVAISRTVITLPKILIFDDSLSNVDTYTEERILGELTKIMADRTTILVSHRISTVKSAHQIVVLKDGRIAERGTHESLMDLQGLYADLYRKQLLEEELALENGV
jgi:hypothetical protein